MKASETKFQPIIEGTKQYVVPLFQRAYSWDKKEWQVLWDDLTFLRDNDEPKSHFIGSIVNMPTTSVPEGVTKYLLIDGQQRLTTIFVLLAVLRDRAKDEGDNALANKIEQTMLVNPFEDGSDYLKLLPTQIDRAAFQSLIMKEALDEQSQIAGCYQFFKRKLRPGIAEVQSLSKVVTSRLSVVSIVLDPDDNPHLVFESLNATGRPLTQADLIRNYFLMKVHANEQETIYSKHWEPMQLALGDNLTECIRHYLMRNGVFVKQGDVYFVLKDRVKNGSALSELGKIAIFARYYQKLIVPQSEPEPKIRNALIRLNRLEVTTAYPFLLNCYHDYAEGQLSLQDFVTILQIVENFVVRRFVCNVPTSQYNKLFPSLYDWAKAKNLVSFVDAVRLELQGRDYPRDLQFQKRLLEAKLYGAGERAVKTKLILETLEGVHQHKEHVSTENLTIEHILPQTPTEWWQQHLGEDWEIDYELYLHTIGNLTLTAYNAELSNYSFSKKQQYLAESHLELNKYFEDLSHWNRAAIEARSKVLADLALTAWPYFGDDQPLYAPTSADAATGKTPRFLIIRGERMAVDSWRDVQRKTLSSIADVEPELFATLAENYPHFINIDSGRFRRYDKLNNGYYINMYLSAERIYRFCAQAVESIGLTKEDWVVETD